MFFGGKIYYGVSMIIHTTSGWTIMRFEMGHSLFGNCTRCGAGRFENVSQ